MPFTAGSPGQLGEIERMAQRTEMMGTLAPGGAPPTGPPPDPYAHAARVVLERLRGGTSAGRYERDLRDLEELLRELLGP